MTNPSASGRLRLQALRVVPRIHRRRRDPTAARIIAQHDGWETLPESPKRDIC